MAGCHQVDSCGTEKNISLFADLLNASGVPVLLENCHEGAPTRMGDGSVSPSARLSCYPPLHPHPPSSPLLKHLLKGEGGCSRMTVSPTARSVRCDMNLFRTSKDIRPTYGGHALSCTPLPCSQRFTPQRVASPPHKGLHCALPYPHPLLAVL